MYLLILNYGGCILHGMGRHNTRQRILQLVKDTSAKLKSLSESDRDTHVNVMYLSLPPPPPFCQLNFSFVENFLFI